MSARWYDEALCVGSDVSVFFPEQGDSAEPAKAICRQCPVAEACLEENLYEIHGVYGGKSGKERQVIRRDRNRALMAAHSNDSTGLRAVS
jgi:WhiB family redox-sensing transcriptional regulator